MEEHIRFLIVDGNIRCGTFFNGSRRCSYILVLFILRNVLVGIGLDMLKKQVSN